MTFYLEKLTGLEINPRNNDLELYIENSGSNKISIMKELLDEFGFDLIFISLCESLSTLVRVWYGIIHRQIVPRITSLKPYSF